MSAPSRYHRQEILPGVGPQGQARLARAHAAIVGLGALGCALADHLARAGVGTLTLIDRDLVDASNLQRQSLYTEADAAEALPKAEAARRRLGAINSTIDVRAHIADLTSGNAEALLPGGAEVLLDGTDNFETRYLLNDLAVRDGIPLVLGGVVGTGGTQMTVRPGESPCLRCLFEDPPAPGTQPTCESAGVLGPAVAIVAACQASDAIRLLLGRGAHIAPTLLEFDLWAGRRRRLDLSGARRDDCPCCGGRRFVFLESAAARPAALCGQEAVQVPGGGGAIDLAALAERLRPAGEVTARSYMVRLSLAAEVGESGRPVGLTVFRDGRAIVSGTALPDRARAIYARFVGA